jgi:hypothetical protein
LHDLKPGPHIWLVTVAVAAIAAVFAWLEPIAQWPGYHAFADRRVFLGMPNAQNVLSNLGLVLVGVWGMMFLAGQRGRLACGGLRPAYLVFFTGLLLTGLGSAWYHLRPDNATLVWDRLPMTVMFMGFLAAVIGEHAGPQLARRWLGPLLLVGVGSVAWWAWTESVGAGDLRPYGLVQFLPALCIVMMLFLYASPPGYTPYIVAMLALYGLAKLAEQFDHETYVLTGLVSGHALKHLLAAAAAGSILLMLFRRSASGMKKYRQP